MRGKVQASYKQEVKERAKLKTINVLSTQSTQEKFENSIFQHKNNICHSEAKPKNLTFSNQNEIFRSAQYDNDKQNFTPPFAIPKTWAWVRLGEVCGIVMGQSPDGRDVLLNQTESCHAEALAEVSQIDFTNRDSSVALLPQNDKFIEFHQGKIAFSEKFIKKSNFVAKNPTKIADKDSILLCVRAPVGVINVTDRAIAIGRGLCALKSNFTNNEFLYYLLCTLQSYFEKVATGSTFKAISVDIVNETLIPLPPLEEQKEIVQRLDTLFALTKGLKCE